MKITMMCIVFNVLDVLPKNMLELCVQNMYDNVDEIIIVEGATKATNHYFDGNTSLFTNDGRSKDGTIEYILELEKKYDDDTKGFDPDNSIYIEWRTFD